MKSIEKQWLDYIEDHLQESHKSALEVSRTIQNSPLEYEVPNQSSAVPIYTRTLHLPKFFTQQDKENFEKLCQTFYSIFEKTIVAYQNDPEIRALFHFSPELEELIALEPGYQAAIPVLRIDIFYDEETGDFKVCEFNTDGTSAMYENDLMFKFLAQNNVWKALKPEVSYMPLMNPLVDALLLDLEQATGKKKPVIAISDFLENAYLPELYAIEQLLQDRGYIAQVVDIRDLQYDGVSLYSPKTGVHYDALYRRAVTQDVLDHLDEIKPFLQAVKEEKIVLAGAFKTQIPHSKTISEALFEPALQKYFTEQEVKWIEAHLPEAFDLTPETAGRVKQDRKHWIIKPKEGYGAKGVYAGVDLAEKHWQKLVDDLVDHGYIVEEYIPHYQSMNIDLLGPDGLKPYSNLTGLYVFNGRFAGVYSRLSDAGIVSTQYNERMVPTLFLKEDQ